MLARFGRGKLIGPSRVQDVCPPSNDAAAVAMVVDGGGGR